MLSSDFLSLFYTKVSDVIVGGLCFSLAFFVSFRVMDKTYANKILFLRRFYAYDQSNFSRDCRISTIKRFILTDVFVWAIYAALIRDTGGVMAGAHDVIKLSNFGQFDQTVAACV